MKRSCNGGTPRRARWRPFAWATAALMAAGMAAGFATAASAQPGPAPGVAPGATSVGGTSYVFYTASDGSVWQKQVGGGPATSVGGVIVSAPSPVTVDTGTIFVFGEGTNNALWYASCTPGGGCGAWTSLGGVLTSKPGAVQTGAHVWQQSVYVRGSDGTMWARDDSLSGWGPWRSAGGRLLSGTGPAATFGQGQYVLVTGTDRQLWRLQPGVPGFVAVGGRTNSSPGLTAPIGSGPVIGYATGTDNAGWYETVSTVGGSWQPLGGNLTSGFGATTISNFQHVYGYALGGNTQVWENVDRTSTWTQVTP